MRDTKFVECYKEIYPSGYESIVEEFEMYLKKKSREKAKWKKENQKEQKE